MGKIPQGRCKSLSPRYRQGTIAKGYRQGTDPLWVIDVAGEKALFRSQADWLYLSTHGTHSAIHGYPGGVLLTIAQNDSPPPYRQYVSPEEVKWDLDLDLVIIAGCSVLDINDYNNHYDGTDHLDSPGKRCLDSTRNCNGSE